MLLHPRTGAATLDKRGVSDLSGAFGPSYAAAPEDGRTPSNRYI
jgi:hypothetical protein